MYITGNGGPENEPWPWRLDAVPLPRCRRSFAALDDLSLDLEPLDTAMFDSSSALADLTMEGLEQLGVPLGHRALLARAIFKGVLPNSPIAGPYSPQVSQQPSVHAAPAEQGATYTNDCPARARWFGVDRELDRAQAVCTFCPLNYPGQPSPARNWRSRARVGGWEGA